MCFKAITPNTNQTQKVFSIKIYLALKEMLLIVAILLYKDLFSYLNPNNSINNQF